MNQELVEKVRDTLVTAGSTFPADRKEAYRCAIDQEQLARAKWAMQTILENAEVAEQTRKPLCDDTGIPHVFIEVGPNRAITGEMMESIREGIREGLRLLPGRPMAIKGSDTQRLDQSGGLDQDPGALEPAPFVIQNIEEDVIRIHVLMFGGGPAIRGLTQRVFHKHNAQVVADEIVTRASEAVRMLGCSPCTLAVGIGRSQVEATALMLEAMVKGRYDKQTEMEQYITGKLNETGVGPLGLGGGTSVLATFMKVGPQRASGVRVVAMRPCCWFEPRIATLEL